MPELNQNNSLILISKSAIQAYEKIGTPEFEIYFQKYVSCLKSQFFKYLCEIYKYDEIISASSTVALQQEKAHNLLTNTYMALMSNSTKIRSLVVNFKPEKGTVESKEEAFIRYFTHTVKLDGIKEGQVEKNNDISHGVTKKFNNAEISLLRRIIKFKQDYEIENITDEYLKWFCEEHNLSYKKIRDIWQKNCDSYVISGEMTNSEADFTEFDKTAFAEYIKKEYDIDFDEEFLIFLEELNKLYYKSFSNNQKRMYPPCFTRDYIEEYINIMKNSKASYIAGLTYNKARYANGRYVCVRGEVFDYAIETGENAQQNQIADYFKVSGPYMTKLKKEVEVKIKEKIKKTF